MSSLGRHVVAGSYAPVGNCSTGPFDVGSFIWRPADSYDETASPTERLSRPSTRS